MKKITIAIDGYSSCGKSTMAKDLAREIGYIYIDSGAMYRAVTLYSLQKGFFTERGIDTEALNFIPVKSGDTTPHDFPERYKCRGCHPQHGSFLSCKPYRRLGFCT